MRFIAKARYVRFSPTKLRLLADVLRQKKQVSNALHWLATCAVKRAMPLQKVLESAVANAKNLSNIDPESLAISEIRVDKGPSVRYYKPGAMGKSNPYRKQLSHLSVILEPINKDIKG